MIWIRKKSDNIKINNIIGTIRLLEEEVRTTELKIKVLLILPIMKKT
jgi:hypothetical protein